MVNKKWFLYATEFFGGMAVMAIELGASRLLAPYFSSSQIVWTVIIGTIMIALAIGNVWGGKLADKDPNPSRLFIRLLIVAVWTALIPLLGKYVIALVSLVLALFVKSGFLVWASIISCGILFVFPLMLLGTITPSLVKYTVQNLEDNGKIVGMLEALNTIGSIIGTFVPTFLTIPTVGTSWTFIIFALVLFILSATYFIAQKIHLVKTGVSLVLIIVSGVVSSLSGFAFWNNDLIYEGESIYNYLQVYETPNQLVLSTNVLFAHQSVKPKDDGLTGGYYDYALAAPYMSDMVNKPDGKVLILGLGAGTYADQCLKYIDNARVEGVEIDQGIVDVAYEYFKMDARVQTHVFDGRAFLSVGEGKDKSYDVIMVDAYQDITIPFQMSSVEFFTLTKNHLNENGVMVVNMNMYSDEVGSINNYLADTISSVYKNVSTVKIGSNRILFATDRDDYLQAFANQIEKIEDGELKSFLHGVQGEIRNYQPTNYILTDDKAPVELLGIKLIDKMIIDEINFFKEYLKDNSIFDLFKMLT